MLVSRRCSVWGLLFPTLGQRRNLCSHLGCVGGSSKTWGLYLTSPNTQPSTSRQTINGFFPFPLLGFRMHYHLDYNLEPRATRRYTPESCTMQNMNRFSIWRSCSSDGPVPLPYLLMDTPAKQQRKLLETYGLFNLKI